MTNTELLAEVERLKAERNAALEAARHALARRNKSKEVLP